MADVKFFSFEVQGADKVKLAFAGLASKIGNWTDIWRTVHNQGIKPWLKKQRDSEGAAGAHGAWPALSPRYAAIKERRWGKKPILQASGQMWREILSDDNVEFGRRTLTYNSPAPAIYHQMGFRTQLGRGRRTPLAGGVAFVPARRIFDPDESFKKAVRVSVARGIAGYATALGFRVAGHDLTPTEARQIGVARIQAGYAE
jgi:hypothetical protein